MGYRTNIAFKKIQEILVERQTDKYLRDHERPAVDPLAMGRNYKIPQELVPMMSSIFYENGLLYDGPLCRLYARVSNPTSSTLIGEFYPDLNLLRFVRLPQDLETARNLASAISSLRGTPHPAKY